MDYALAIDIICPGAKYGGSLTANTEAAYNAIRWEDDRPKPTIAELAAAQVSIQAAAACQAIDKKTSDLINRGHIYAGKVFSTSQSAQNNALAVSAMISRGVDFTGTVLSNIDNTDEHIVINNADMQEFADSCMNHIAYHKRIGGNLKKIIRDAEDPSTVEDNR